MKKMDRKNVISILVLIIVISCIIITIIRNNKSISKININNKTISSFLSKESVIINNTDSNIEKSTLNITSISSTNTYGNKNNTDNNISIAPYIPNNIETINSQDTTETTNEDIKASIDPKKVSIEIVEDTLSNKGMIIIITDTNDIDTTWSEEYKLQEKVNNNWKDLKPIQPLVFKEMAYYLDENNQYKQTIKWEKFYGKLKKGHYKLVKTKFLDKEYTFSIEFNID